MFADGKFTHKDRRQKTLQEWAVYESVKMRYCGGRVEVSFNGVGSRLSLPPEGRGA